MSRPASCLRLLVLPGLLASAVPLPVAAQPDTVAVFTYIGVSNANRMYHYSRDTFANRYGALSGRESYFVRSAVGHSRLLQQSGRDDWHPASDGELYDAAVAATLAGYADAQAQHPQAVVIPGGFLANFGSDQSDIRDGLATQADVEAAMRALLDAFARDLPDWPVYWITAGTSASGDLPAAQAFRRMEVGVCEGHPACYTAADRTGEFALHYVVCATDACRQQWFEDNVHFADPARDLLMEAAAGAAARVARGGDASLPVIAVGASPLALRSKNGRYHSVDLNDLDLAVSDNGVSGAIPASSVVVTAAASDETELAAGSGNTSDDAVIASGCRSVEFRQERATPGDGRVYTLHLAVADPSGNVGRAAYKVSVRTHPNTPATEQGPAYAAFSTCEVGPLALAGGQGNASASAASVAGAPDAEAGGALPAGIPSEVVLQGAHPNPSSSSSAIRYGLPAAAHVRLRVYDVTGRLVATVEEGERAAGYHEAVVEGGRLASGVYLYRLEAGSHILTGRFSVAR